MKKPGEKGGLDTWVDLPDPASAIIETMPRTEDRIFPFHSNTISRRFTDACKLLGIQDLHFHDLRHEGTSRLAEMGRTTPQLASATGHKSWQSLERYTHIHRAGDKFLDWEWTNEIGRASAVTAETPYQLGPCSAPRIATLEPPA